MSADDARAVRGLEEVKRSFNVCFGGPAGQAVLIYLADFCRAAESCVAIGSKGGPIDMNRTMILEGRREVFLEMQKFLNLTPEHLFLLATGRSYRTGDTDDE